jgi:hypothetical protein
MNVAQTAEDLRYPIGKAVLEKDLSESRRRELIGIIASAPKRFRDAVAGLSDKQLDTPYRPGGWTLRQTIHHVADSHMNANIRIRLALTEKTPAIKTYEEQLWAELPDAKSMPIDVSLQIIDAVHARMDKLLGSLKGADFQRTFSHPQWGELKLEGQLCLYAWHTQHHAAHITNLRKREGW